MWAYFHKELRKQIYMRNHKLEDIQKDSYEKEEILMSDQK